MPSPDVTGGARAQGRWVGPPWTGRFWKLYVQPLAHGAPAQLLRRARAVLHGLVLAGLAAFLVFKLQAIGWREVWRALPGDADFYIVLMLAYTVAPLCDAVIYGRLWGLGARALPLFFRKRVFNEVLLDYSGEAYFWAAARRLTPGGNPGGGPGGAALPRALLSVVRDVNLLSGLVSNTATLLLLAFVLHMGVPGLPDIPLWAIAAGALIPVGVMLAIVLARFFSLTRDEAFMVGALQALRLATVLALQALVWTIALPHVPFDRWLVVLAAQMAVTRLPFLPNRDLVMSGVALSLAGVIGVSEAELAATFMAIAALMLVLHGLVLVLTARHLPGAAREPVPGPAMTRTAIGKGINSGVSS